MKFESKSLYEMSRAVRHRALSALKSAGCGHIGIAMGAADIVTTVYANFLDGGRNKFILSAGHGSALLYSVLKLTDADIPDLKDFRKMGGLPGHPERNNNGVFATTGPLGAGVSNAVGMAMANKIQMAKSGAVSETVYCLASDGDLSEGVAQESIDFAGRYKLNNLVLLWDDNGVTIDGSALTAVDMATKMKGCGWNVLRIDGHNFDELNAALERAKTSKKPVFIQCTTTIGLGTVNAGKSAAHGFDIDDLELGTLVEQLKSDAGVKLWDSVKIRYKRLDFSVIADSQKIKIQSLVTDKKISTRELSGLFLKKIMPHTKNLIGGSADLSSSTNTNVGNEISNADLSGNILKYGIREHAMAGIMNGMTVGGLRCFGSTFLVFSDYMRAGIRLSALSGLPVIYVLTHDSVMVGEDGPTHQPIEQTASLRLIPNLNVFRPANEAEVIYSWEKALMDNHTPSCILLSRQAFEQIPTQNPADVKKGGYVIYKPETKQIKATIIATGAEVALAVSVAKKLNNSVQVVSMPCVSEFKKQSKKYKKETLAGYVCAIEAGATAGWFEFADAVVGIDEFGLSGSGDAVYKHFGFDSDLIASEISKKIKRSK